MKDDKKRSVPSYSIEELEKALQNELNRETKQRELFSKLKSILVPAKIFNVIKTPKNRLLNFAGKFKQTVKNKLSKSSAEKINKTKQKRSDVSDKNETSEKPSGWKFRSKKERRRFIFTVIKRTLSTMAVVAAVAVLIANLWLPVLRIYGSSMAPTVEEGEIVVTVKGSDFQTGDVLGFYYNNKILIKRVIAGPGSWVNIEENGDVFVDGKKIDEPYLKEKSFGDCNINLPYQVPDKRYFVLGDHRSTSVDSRNSAVGCVSEDQIIGRILFRVWPFESFGFVN